MFHSSMYNAIITDLPRRVIVFIGVDGTVGGNDVVLKMLRNKVSKDRIGKGQWNYLKENTFAWCPSFCSCYEVK